MALEGLPTAPTVPFPEAARLALANTQLRRNMGKAPCDGSARRLT